VFTTDFTKARHSTLHHQGDEALMMEAASTSETSINFCQTRRNIPEDSHLHTRHRENLKSHFVLKMYVEDYEVLSESLLTL
jgi:hypothetical protein